MRKFNKKGFTLVEMIVVITIIGVLAAILIPMVIGYVLQSRISAANYGASRIKDSITYFLTEADCKGYGMPLSKDITCDLDIVINNGVWTITMPEESVSVFSETSNVRWEATGSATASTDLADSANATERLAQHLASSFPGENFGFIKTRFCGICATLYYTKDQNCAVDNFPDFGNYNGWSVPDYAWLNAEQGLYNLGIVVGTSPVLPLSDI